jgi:hypothetical protein
LEYPNVSIFRHPIFLSDQFKDFQRSVVSNVQQSNDSPDDMVVKRALPHLSRAMNTGFAATNDNISATNANVSACFSQLWNKVQDLEAQIHEMQHRPLKLSVTLDPLDSPSLPASVPASLPDSCPQSSTPWQKTYQLKRNFQTVPQVWEEYELGWKVGLSGQRDPSVKSLENKYGVSWRKDRTESRYFNTRNILYQELERIAAVEHISLQDAAHRLEQTRVQKGFTLNTLSKYLRRAR